MSPPCQGCLAELSHCHGSLVVHADGTAECTEAHCRDVDTARHGLVVVCEEITTTCRCS